MTALMNQEKQSCLEVAPDQYQVQLDANTGVLLRAWGVI